MANKETVYSVVEEAVEMVQQLCDIYADELWCVTPNNVSVLGIENKKRGKKNRTLARIKCVRGAEKAVMQIHHVPVRYIIEMYWADWNEWKERKRQAIVFHELLHIADEVGKTVKHDCEDFRMMIDKLGVDWVNSEDLPDFLDKDNKVEFNLELRPSIADIDITPTEGTEDDEEGTEDDEEGEPVAEVEETVEDSTELFEGK